jgi:hypothetical protein
MKKAIILFWAIFLYLAGCAQNSVNAAGGEAVGAGSVSFTLGQVSYTTLNSNDGNYLIQGVQIPFEFICEPPLNDECSNVTPENQDFLLECGDISEGTSLNATGSIGLTTECGVDSSILTNDVWYLFEADGLSEYFISIEANTSNSDSQMDPVLSVYAGECGNLTEIDCSNQNDSSEFSNESITLVDLTAGLYYIRVSSQFGDAPFIISLSCSNDCQNPFPAVSEASLNTTQLENAFTAEWDPIPGQIGCQVQVRIAEGSLLGAQIIGGTDVGSLNIPKNALQPASDYEWRVRCGCSQQPLVAGAFSSWQPFSTPGEIIITSSPNPTSGHSRVSFEVFQEGYTKLEVFYLNGQLIKTLFEEYSKPKTDYVFNFDGSYLPSGIYIYRLTTDDLILNKKFVITK